MLEKAQTSNQHSHSADYKKDLSKSYSPRLDNASLTTDSSYIKSDPNLFSNLIPSQVSPQVHTQIPNSNSAKNYNEESLKQTLKLLLSVEMEKFQKAQDKKFAEMKSTHSQEIKEMKSTHSQEIKEMKSTHSQEIKEMKSTHSQEINEIVSNHNKQISALNEKIENLSYRVRNLELVIRRSNANLDLIVNRDTIRTILLLFAINEKIITYSEAVEEYNDGEIHSKISYMTLIKRILCHLTGKPDPFGFHRSENYEKNFKGFSRGKEDYTKNITVDTGNCNKKLVIDNEKIIFVEFCHFLVLVFDKIVHPGQKNADDEEGEDDNEKLISQISGNKSLSSLEQGLKLFFEDTREMCDLKQIFDNSENDIKLMMETYNSVKKYIYFVNKKCCENLGVNNYIKKFFLEKLFYPSHKENDFSKIKLNITLQKFNERMKQIIDDFKKKKNIGKSPESIIYDLIGINQFFYIIINCVIFFSKLDFFV